MFTNNDSGGNKQEKCPQQVESGSMNFLGMKTDTAPKNFFYYEQKESASEASREPILIMLTVGCRYLD